MQLSLDHGLATYRISGYGEGYVLINDERLESSLVVMPEQLIRDWEPPSIADLRPPHLEQVIGKNPEVLLLGTGARQHFPETSRLEPLVREGLGFEIMDTAAASRTYNILMAEGRVVAAALFMIRS